MVASIKNKALISLLIFTVLVFMLFDLPNDILNMKFLIFVFCMLVASWVDYNRGYLDGKAYYTENDGNIPLKQSKTWDHKLALQALLVNHPFCYLELDHAPCVEHDYPLPSGIIHLVQNDKHYTTLHLQEDGWVYAADTSLGRDVLRSGKYQPMLTCEAMRISQDKLWEIYF